MRQLTATCFLPLAMIILLTGCTYYDNNQKSDHRDMNVSNQSNHIAYRNGNNQIANMNWSSGNNQLLSKQQNFYIPTDTENRLNQFDELLDGQFIMTNQAAYVAIVLKRGNNLDANLQSRITNYIKSTYKNIKDVYISSNPHFVQEINEFSIRIQRGDQNMNKDFQNMVQNEFNLNP